MHSDGPLEEITQRLRIAVIDDDTVIREGLPLLVPELDIVVSARTVEQFLALARRQPVDVVLTDLNLQAPSGARVRGRAAVQTVVAAGYRSLLYTNENRPFVLAQCLAAGAAGIVHKAESLTRLAGACRTVAAGGGVVSTAVAGLMEAVMARRTPSLTARQLEVLRLRARGETIPAIAAALQLSPRTVEEHLAVVVHRFGPLLGSMSPGDIEHALGVRPGDLIT